MATRNIYGGAFNGTLQLIWQPSACAFPAHCDDVRPLAQDRSAYYQRSAIDLLCELDRLRGDPIARTSRD